MIWCVVGSRFVHVTVVPLETVTNCGLKAYPLMVMETLVWFSMVAVIWGVGAVVATVVARVVTAGVVAIGAWVVGAGPEGDSVQPAINTTIRIAAPRIRTHLREREVLIGIPQDMVTPVG